MNNPIKFAVDAMGGDNSPSKVIKGIEVVDIISNLETDRREWPHENVKIEVEILD